MSLTPTSLPAGMELPGSEFLEEPALLPPGVTTSLWERENMICV